MRGKGAEKDTSNDAGGVLHQHPAKEADCELFNSLLQFCESEEYRKRSPASRRSDAASVPRFGQTGGNSRLGKSGSISFSLPLNAPEHRRALDSSNQSTTGEMGLFKPKLRISHIPSRVLLVKGEEFHRSQEASSSTGMRCLIPVAVGTKQQEANEGGQRNEPAVTPPSSCASDLRSQTTWNTRLESVPTACDPFYVSFAVPPEDHPPLPPVFQPQLARPVFPVMSPTFASPTKEEERTFRRTTDLPFHLTRTDTPTLEGVTVKSTKSVASPSQPQSSPSDFNKVCTIDVETMQEIDQSAQRSSLDERPRTRDSISSYPHLPCSLVDEPCLLSRQRFQSTRSPHFHPSPQVTPTSQLKRMSITDGDSPCGHVSALPKLPFTTTRARKANHGTATPSTKRAVARKSRKLVAINCGEKNKQESARTTKKPLCSGRKEKSVNIRDSNTVMTEASGSTLSSSQRKTKEASESAAVATTSIASGATAVQSTTLDLDDQDDDHDTSKLGEDDVVVLDDEIGPNDVILGRGAGPSTSEGNVQLRKLVERCFPAYCHWSSTKGIKTKIVREVVNEITVRRKGRFLKKCSEMSAAQQHRLGSRQCWEVVSQCEARRKVSQRFRQTKIDLGLCDNNRAIHGIVPCLYFYPETQSWLFRRSAPGATARAA